MKKEITSFDIATIVLELKRLIINAWVANIYQIDVKTLVLKLNQPNQPTLHLLIEAGNRLHLTRIVSEKPSKPSAFCMALRKHLRNGKVQTVEQHEFERIVTIRIKAKREEFQLICELFGDGNIILVSPENKILQALSYRRMRDRNILRNETFLYPPPSGKNPLRVERSDLDEIRNYEQLEIVKALARFFAIGGFYAEEILLRAQIDKNVQCVSLNSNNLDSVFNALKELLSTIKNEQFKPSIIVNENGEWIDVVPFSLTRYSNFKTKLYPSFNEALDEFYAERGVEREIITVTSDVKQLLAQQERILAKQQKTLKELEGKIEKNKKIGDIIYAHFGELQLLVQKIMEEKNSGKSWNTIVSALEKARKEATAPATYYRSLDPQNAILHLSIDELTFPINLRKSIQENAAEFYEKTKKSQKRREGAEKALLGTRQRMAELKEQKIERISAISKPPVQKVEKKAWYEKFRWFHSSEGFLVLGGKDAMTNEILVKKHMEAHDLVFHADIRGAPFVIVKTERHKVSEGTINEAAEFAAAFSRAWKEMFSAVDVYWVRPEQVSKTPPTGQFLPKGSFMIYGKKNYLRKVPLHTAIGILIKEERQIKIIGGPKDAIASQTEFYIQIAPGDHSSEKLAKQIRQLLSQKAPKEWRENMLSVSLNEIQKFIPPGKGTILP